ncbi:SET and MYND domain-containing protein 4-like [Prorops nasuta]|uniref:SET and MYND domain-containing protein 4-like n=1 Tax=Prorops nasuta TaxID=863751 RepID=UPI0034CE3244
MDMEDIVFLSYVLTESARKKSNSKSKELVSAGDQLYKINEFEDAISVYTDAIRTAKPNTSILGSCYLRRAKALENRKAYNDALSDLNFALSLLKSKAKQKQIEGMIGTVNLKIKDLKKENIINSSDDSKPMVIEEENKEIPGCSSLINICYNTEYGRYFQATKPIKSRQVLLSVEPYLFILNDEKELDYCHYCGSHTLALIPCDSCAKALYCSFTCRQKAYESYHEVECKLGIFQENLNAILRLFLMVTKQGLLLKEMIDLSEKKNQNPRRAGFVSDKFIGNTAQAVLSLQCNPNNLFEDSVLVTKLIVSFLSSRTDLITPYNVLGVLNFIQKLNFIFMQNAIQVRGIHFEDILGMALYPVYNLFNHSCVPNTLCFNTHDLKQVLIACKDIDNNEQVFGNNLSTGTVLLTAAGRKKILKDFKNFKCTCVACNNNYTFKPEIRNLKVPEDIKSQWKKDPASIENMWRVLEYMYKKVKEPCLEIEVMKFAISDAYLGNKNAYIKEMCKKLKVI